MVAAYNRTALGIEEHGGRGRTRLKIPGNGARGRSHGEVLHVGSPSLGRGWNRAGTASRDVSGDRHGDKICGEEFLCPLGRRSFFETKLLVGKLHGRQAVCTLRSKHQSMRWPTRNSQGAGRERTAYKSITYRAVGSYHPPGLLNEPGRVARLHNPNPSHHMGHYAVCSRPSCSSTFSTPRVRSSRLHFAAYTGLTPRGSVIVSRPSKAVCFGEQFLPFCKGATNVGWKGKIEGERGKKVRNW